MGCKHCVSHRESIGLQVTVNELMYVMSTYRAIHMSVDRQISTSYCITCIYIHCTTVLSSF